MTETDPQKRSFGYARLGTTGQTLAAQLDALKAAGCGKIYREQASGARAERRELQRVLQVLKPGDLVTRIDRLARSTSSTCSPSSGPSPTLRRSSAA